MVGELETCARSPLYIGADRYIARARTIWEYRDSDREGAAIRCQASRWEALCALVHSLLALREFGARSGERCSLAAAI